MPTLELKTNVKVDDPREFIKEFSEFSAHLLNKPLKYICVSYDYKEHLAFEGTLDPAFILNISSLDNINHVANEQYSARLFQFLEEKLNVKGHRGYVVFTDPGRENMAHESKTFGTIFGLKPVM